MPLPGENPETSGQMEVDGQVFGGVPVPNPQDVRLNAIGSVRAAYQSQ